MPLFKPLRKKTTPIFHGNDAKQSPTTLAEELPDTQEVLQTVTKALNRASTLERQIKSRREERRGCCGCC